MTNRTTDALIQELASSPLPLRSLPHPVVSVGVWIVFSMAYLAVLLWLNGGMRPDWNEVESLTSYRLEMLLTVTLTISACIGAHWLSYPDIRQQRFVIVIPLLLLLVLISWQFTKMAVERPPISDIWAGEIYMPLDCAAHIFVFSLLPAAMIYLFMRRAASTHPYLTGGMALLSASSLSYLLLRLAEANDSLLHIFFWHMTPMLILCLIGALLARKGLQW